MFESNGKRHTTMDAAKFLSLKPAEQMAYWICEREGIRVQKEKGFARPWSNDPIMRFTRFTNVRREDDRVTKWIAANWRDNYTECITLPAAMVFARMVNRIETLEEIPFPIVWNSEALYQALKDRVGRGLTTWGNAYMITTCGKRMEKERYVVDVASDVMRRMKDLPDGDLEFWHQWLQRTDGLGSFLAAQVVADLRNAYGWKMEGAKEWCASGPGSKRGINYYFGLEPEAAMSEKVFRQRIAVAWEEVRPLLPTYLHDLHMQDFQNCFCEFSKYNRILNGGRAKNGYAG